MSKRTMVQQTSLKNKFEDIENLTQNWDGYGAVPIKEEIIETAEKFIADLPAEITDHMLIVPKTQGKMQLEWNLGLQTLEIEFTTKDLIKMLLWTQTNEQIKIFRKPDWPKVKKAIKKFLKYE